MQEILLSASQVSTYKNECERKWALRTIAKIKSEPTPAALLGTEVDEGQLQPWLRDGRSFDFTKDSAEIAASAMEWLPPSKSPGLQVQKKFILPGTRHASVGVGYGYLGYKDLWLPDSAALPYLEKFDCQIPAVVDFKTTGDFKWAKNEETLRSDPQAIIYATNALFETGAPAVDLVWLYMRTRGARKSKKVHLRLLKEEVFSEFSKIEDVGVEIVGRRLEGFDKDPTEYALSLRPNPDACEGYGGCPYRAHCNLSPQDQLDFSAALSAPMEGAMSGGLDLLANLAMRADVAAPAMVGINPPEKDLPPAPPENVAAEAVVAEAQEPAKPAAKRGRKAKVAEPAEVEEPAFPADGGATEACTPVLGEEFSVTWAEETYNIDGAVVAVGPFSATGFANKGESLGDAIRRVGAVLHAFASDERDAKLSAVKRALKSVAK